MKNKSKLNQKQMKMINDHTQSTQKLMADAMNELKHDNFKKASILINIVSAKMSNFSNDVSDLAEEMS
jgi:shikimate 5-dehydrogenase